MRHAVCAGPAPSARALRRLRERYAEYAGAAVPFPVAAGRWPLRRWRGARARCAVGVAAGAGPHREAGEGPYPCAAHAPSGPGPVPVPAPTRPRPRPRSRPGHEVPVQGGAPVREAPLRGREDPQEVPGPRPGHRGEGAKGPNRRPGQEEVPGALGPDSGPVLLPDPEADPPAGGGRALLLRQQRHPPH